MAFVHATGERIFSVPDDLMPHNASASLPEPSVGNLRQLRSDGWWGWVLWQLY
jgi:hypothetical protein